MRGFAEESAESVAMRALRGAARRFAAAQLVDDFGGQAQEEERLQKAAIAYAATQPKPRKTGERKR